jgi:hypothetical protein
LIEDVENDIKPWETEGKDYDGGFLDGQRHGSGRQVYPNGEIYKGGWVKDKKHGQGTLWFADGRFFRGIFANDSIKGKGIFKIATGPESLLIEGTFDGHALIAGPSKIQYPNGEVFEGRVNAQGKRDGPNGKHNYLNGDVYEGAWSHDHRNGKGKLTFADGGYFSGTFKDDEAHDGKLLDK